MRASIVFELALARVRCYLAAATQRAAWPPLRASWRAAPPMHVGVPHHGSLQSSHHFRGA